MTGINTFAQSFLSLNSKFYVPGQKLMFSFYAVDEESLISVNLIDANKNVLSSQFYSFEGNHFLGEFDIPDVTSEGIYYLISYNSSGYMVAPISIGLPDKISFGNGSTIPKLDIKESNNNYQAQDTISVERLMSQDILAAFVDVVPYSAELPVTYDYTKFKENLAPFEIAIEGQNLEGLEVAYSVFDDSDNPIGLGFGKIINSKVALEEKFVSNGQYTYLTIDLEENSFIQSVTWAPALAHILKEVEFPKFNTSLSQIEAKQYVDNLNSRHRIFSDFIKNKTLSKPESTNQINWPVDYSVDLSDYFPFETTTDLIKEILPWVKVKKSKNKGREILLLTNSYNNKIDRTPATLYNYQTLCFVDGVVVFDHDRILAIKPENIETIDVYLNKTFVSGRFFNGIVSFNSKTMKEKAFTDNNVFKLSLPKLNINSTLYKTLDIHSEFNFFTPVFTKSMKINNGVFRLKFKHSNELGKFLINVNLIDSNGKQETSQIIYEVN